MEKLEVTLKYSAGWSDRPAGARAGTAAGTAPKDRSLVRLPGALNVTKHLPLLNITSIMSCYNTKTKVNK